MLTTTIQGRHSDLVPLWGGKRPASTYGPEKDAVCVQYHDSAFQSHLTEEHRLHFQNSEEKLTDCTIGTTKASEQTALSEQPSLKPQNSSTPESPAYKKRLLLDQS